MELENFGCVAMDATEMVNVDGGTSISISGSTTTEDGKTTTTVTVTFTF